MEIEKRLLEELSPRNSKRSTLSHLVGEWFLPNEEERSLLRWFLRAMTRRILLSAE